MSTYLNGDYLAKISAEEFNTVSPFPWLNMHELLRPEKYDELYRDFPSLDFFEFHQDLPRKGGQRPHNRYYLAYEKTIYTKIEHHGKGIVQHSDLPASWQAFIEELNEPAYRSFISRMLGLDDVVLRFAWHVGVNHSEVSPHRDANGKLGTHIFYFNNDEDWQEEWGGATLVLGGMKTEVPNPDFEDFSRIETTAFMNNHSFLFRNTADAWHGVKELTCPEGHYRRLFNAIAHAPKGGSILQRAARLFSRS